MYLRGHLSGADFSLSRNNMTDRELLDEIRRMRHKAVQYVAGLTPEQAQALARLDMRTHSQATKQFERADLHTEMTLRAQVNPHYKAAIDQAAMARLTEALQQLRVAETEPRSSADDKESCK